MREQSINQNNFDLEEADVVQPEAAAEQSAFILNDNFNTTKTQESFNDHKGINKISLNEIVGNAIDKQGGGGYQEAVKILNDTNDNEILDIHINKIEEAPLSPPQNLNTLTND